jgi:hypothetical protein
MHATIKELSETVFSIRSAPRLNTGDQTLGAPHQQSRNSLPVTKIWCWAPDGAWYKDWLADWPSVVIWVLLWLVSSESEVNTSLRCWEIASNAEARIGDNGQELRPWASMRESVVGKDFCSFRSRYQEDTADWEDLVRAVLNYIVYDITIAL